jgi:hypothetical protein
MAKRVTRPPGLGMPGITGQETRSRKKCPRVLCAFCLLASVVSLLSAGCAPNSFGASGNDPLLGLGPPAPPPSGALAGGPRPAAGNVPPLPTASGGAIPASLAATTRPLDPSRPSPHIGADGGAAGADAPVWRGPGSGPSGVVLQQPQPITGGEAVKPQPGSGPAPTVQPTGNLKGAPTFDELQAQLKERGVVWQLLNTTGENGTEWKYSCAVPLKQSPTTRKAYEARGPDPAAAMQKVLQAIDQDSQR